MSGMEITVRSGDREITVRDQRPVLKPSTLADILAAVRRHLDDGEDGPTIVLPFGFTGPPEEGPSAETEGTGTGDGDDRLR